MPKKLNNLSFRTKLLFAVGLSLVLIPSFFYLNQTIQLMFFVPKVQKVTAQENFASPIAITIPRVRINLPVEQTAITNNVWEVSGRGASHLKDSASPGQEGPIILYGHNTRDRFGPIRWLSQGDAIYLATNDNKQHKYLIMETVQVNPDQLSIFFSRQTETLYLYTCDGFADLKRFIIIAQPEKQPTASPSAQ